MIGQPNHTFAAADAPEIEAQNKFLRRNIFAIDVLAYSPYQQLRIEIAGAALGP